MKIFLSLSFLLVLATNVLATATAPCSPISKTFVVHINGIGVDDDATQKNMRALESAYGPKSPQGQVLTYAYAYNKGNSTPDLSLLKNAEADPARARILANALLTGNMTGVDAATTDTLMKDYYGKMSASVAATGAALAQVVDTINLLLAEGPVVIVAHSQGCLVANSAFTALTNGIRPSKFIKIMGVAETAATVTGDPAIEPADKSYVTAKEDRAISFWLPLLMLFTADILPPNIEIGASILDGWNHDFVDTYLNPKYIALAEIKKKIGLALNGLQQNGALLVTATWSPFATGIELHMIVNGSDAQITTGRGAIMTGLGTASYCMNFTPTTPDTLFAPMVYNRGTTLESVTLTVPWGSEMLTSIPTGNFAAPVMGSIISSTKGVVTKWGGSSIVIPEYTGTITLPPISTDFNLPPAQTVSTQDSLSNFGLPPLVLSLGKRI